MGRRGICPIAGRTNRFNVAGGNYVHLAGNCWAAAWLVAGVAVLPPILLISEKDRILTYAVTEP